jgi:hypothetical protein
VPCNCYIIFGRLIAATRSFKSVNAVRQVHNLMHVDIKNIETFLSPKNMWPNYRVGQKLLAGRWQK